MRAFAGFGQGPDTSPSGAMTRARSGVGTDVQAVSPSPSRSSVGMKPLYTSPSRSLSDSGEGLRLSVHLYFICCCTASVAGLLEKQDKLHVG